jgi:hypothetical protein
MTDIDDEIEEHGIRGRCPMCALSMLVVRDERIRCLQPECPDPEAVSKLLEATGQHDHFLTIGPVTGFSLEHPLRERIDEKQSMATCPLQFALNLLWQAPAPAGRYRVALINGKVEILGLAPAPGAPAEVIHAVPREGAAKTPCCRRLPLELPRFDRITIEPEIAITCSGEPGWGHPALLSEEDGKRPIDSGAVYCSFEGCGRTLIIDPETMWWRHLPKGGE